MTSILTFAYLKTLKKGEKSALPQRPALFFIVCLCAWGSLCVCLSVRVSLLCVSLRLSLCATLLVSHTNRATAPNARSVANRNGAAHRSPRPPTADSPTGRPSSRRSIAKRNMRGPTETAQRATCVANRNGARMRKQEEANINWNIWSCVFTKPTRSRN